MTHEFKSQLIQAVLVGSLLFVTISVCGIYLNDRLAAEAIENQEMGVTL